MLPAMMRHSVIVRGITAVVFRLRILLALVLQFRHT